MNKIFSHTDSKGAEYFSRFTRRAALVFFMAVALLLVACSSPDKVRNRPEPTPLPHDMAIDPPNGSDFLSMNTYVGDAIAGMLLTRMSGNSGLLYTNLVRFDNMEGNTEFGRLSSHQIASRIAQRGFKVYDIHLMENIVVNRNGEFILSRDLAKLLASEYNAGAVLVGTYSMMPDKIYISVRVLRLTDGVIIAAYEYYMPITNDVAYTLGLKQSKGIDGEFQQYTARGRAFENCPPAVTPSQGTTPVQQPVTQPAQSTVKDAPYDLERPSGLQQPYAPSASYVETRPSGGQLPEKVDILEGGQVVDPNAKPTPVGRWGK